MYQLLNISDLQRTPDLEKLVLDHAGSGQKGSHQITPTCHRLSRAHSASTDVLKDEYTGPGRTLLFSGYYRPIQPMSVDVDGIAGMIKDKYRTAESTFGPGGTSSQVSG